MFFSSETENKSYGASSHRTFVDRAFLKKAPVYKST